MRKNQNIRKAPLMGLLFRAILSHFKPFLALGGV
jgi:hypothetical protein